MSKDNSSDDARKQIDENLKRVYEEHLVADLPDQLMDLLQKLREQDEQRGEDSPS